MARHDAAEGTNPGPRRAGQRGDTETSTVVKALSILELVASDGGMTARQISDHLSMSLPTTYRLLQVLTTQEYLVHIQERHAYELGYKVHGLDISLHRQVGLVPAIHAVTWRLFRAADAASYFALFRSNEVVIADVADSPRRPRIPPLRFGIHEASHATAFGKIMLAAMDLPTREAYFALHPLHPITRHTITDRDELEQRLAEAGRAGIAWEHQEFAMGLSCAAVPVKGAAGRIVGSLAISIPHAELVSDRRRAGLEHQLRVHAREITPFATQI